MYPTLAGTRPVEKTHQVPKPMPCVVALGFRVSVSPGWGGGGLQLVGV